MINISFFCFSPLKCWQIKPEWGCTRSFLVLRRKTSSWNVNRIIYWAFSICSIPELTPTTTHSIPTALLLLQSMPINLITMQHLQHSSPLSPLLLLLFWYQTTVSIHSSFYNLVPEHPTPFPFFLLSEFGITFQHSSLQSLLFFIHGLKSLLHHYSINDVSPHWPYDTFPVYIIKILPNDRLNLVKLHELYKKMSFFINLLWNIINYNP